MITDVYSRVTTVLNSAIGKPAAGVPVQLQELKLDDGPTSDFQVLAQGYDLRGARIEADLIRIHPGLPTMTAVACSFILRRLPVSAGKI